MNSSNSDKKQTKVIRLDMKCYSYLKEASKINKRTIGGQLHWVCEVVEYLEQYNPSLYSKITYHLNQAKK